MGGGGKGGNNNGGGGSQASTANGAANGETAAPNNRGLDSGLAKSAPSAVGLNQRTYRAYRRRLDLFSRQRMRRGKDTAIEGAYLVLSQLQDTAWDATESIDYDDVELAENPFTPVRDMLDLLYQHEEEVELPERCQEFFEQFSREKGEELQAYIVRHQSMLRKLKELQVEVPPLLAGWHLLSRSGVPRWTHPQVKAMCNGTLNVKSVSQALVRMFGGDSKPNARDSVLRGGGEVHYIDGYEYEPEDEEELYYGYEEEWYPGSLRLPMRMLSMWEMKINKVKKCRWSWKKPTWLWTRPYVRELLGLKASHEGVGACTWLLPHSGSRHGQPEQQFQRRRQEL